MRDKKIKEKKNTWLRLSRDDKKWLLNINLTHCMLDKELPYTIFLCMKFFIWFLFKHSSLNYLFVFCLNRFCRSFFLLNFSFIVFSLFFLKLQSTLDHSQSHIPTSIRFSFPFGRHIMRHSRVCTDTIDHWTVRRNYTSPVSELFKPLLNISPQKSLIVLRCSRILIEYVCMYVCGCAYIYRKISANAYFYRDWYKFVNFVILRRNAALLFFKDDVYYLSPRSITFDEESMCSNIRNVLSLSDITVNTTINNFKIELD